MALFRRTEKTTIPELQEYYENQRGTRTGMAWLMALASLVITIAVLSGLFFGGRWVYRTIADRNSDDTTETVTEEGPKNQQAQPQANTGSSTPNTGNSSSAPTSAPATTPSTGRVSDQAASTSTPNTGSTTATAGATATIPNTGPADLMLIIVTVAVAMLGTVVASAYQAKKQ